ncbi:MAG: formyltetrahydrofolate deformylase [Candidatus Sericytochromatia bacterium]
MNKHIITIQSQDQKGLVFRVTQILYTLNLNVEKNDEFVDKENNIFFMRTEVDGDLDSHSLKDEIIKILPENSSINILKKRKKDIVILVTKESHCLGDILMRYYAGDLDINIQAIISNHSSLKDISEKFNIPFHFISHENLTREEHETNVINLIDNYSFDYIVLAKYMRILTPNFVKKYESKIINIHHSFLPAFIGANPYKQAYERGVKIIGATAHFVNESLDEGPIIFQNTVNVDHSYSWKDMQKAGRDVEKLVLSKALDLAINDRIFVYKNRTVIF